MLLVDFKFDGCVFLGVREQESTHCCARLPFGLCHDMNWGLVRSFFLCRVSLFSIFLVLSIFLKQFFLLDGWKNGVTLRWFCCWSHHGESDAPPPPAPPLDLPVHMGPALSQACMAAEELTITLHIRETEVKNWELEVQAMYLKMVLGLERVASVATIPSVTVHWTTWQLWCEQAHYTSPTFHWIWNWLIFQCIWMYCKQTLAEKCVASVTAVQIGGQSVHHY